MHSFVIVDQIAHWHLAIENVQIITSKDYLTSPYYAQLRHVRICNLCSSYRYQSSGYYVSLLAEAREHRVFPSVKTLQDFKYQTILRTISDEIDELIQKSLSKLKSDEFALPIYFGKSLTKQYEKLCLQLYNLFQSPLLRAKFSFNDKWILQDVSTIALKDVPQAQQEALQEFAKEYFSKPYYHRRKKQRIIYDLAILHNSSEIHPPSDEGAMDQFVEAAEELGFGVELITKNDFSKIPFFDALFIRETTAVNHHTYRFARRAAAEGLVVIDDPESIIKCTNKVYLAELLAHAKIPTPNTVILYKGKLKEALPKINFPCVLKLPDSSFSQAVLKIEDVLSLKKTVQEFFDRSDLLVIQDFVPTDFDWRIGILDRQPLFACKYYMAKKHWQIYKWEASKVKEGKFETLAIENVPPYIVKTALKAADLIGDGFYGVDLKELNGKPYVIEVNDNPSVEEDVEDAVLKDELYYRIMKTFLTRIQKQKEQSSKKQEEGIARRNF